MSEKSTYFILGRRLLKGLVNLNLFGFLATIVYAIYNLKYTVPVCYIYLNTCNKSRQLYLNIHLQIITIFIQYGLADIITQEREINLVSSTKYYCIKFSRFSIDEVNCFVLNSLKSENDI